MVRGPGKWKLPSPARRHAAVSSTLSGVEASPPTQCSDADRDIPLESNCGAALPSTEPRRSPVHSTGTLDADDFVIVKRNPCLDRRGVFAIVGPGLDLDGIPFVRLEDAIKRGSEIARRSGVSLWDTTTGQSVVLVGAFRR